MKDMIGYCGLDCETCGAYIGTINDDQALREKTAKLWAELNNVSILPEHINCEGCRANGAKTVFCEHLCEIRKCALSKGITTCGDCPELESCARMFPGETVYLYLTAPLSCVKYKLRVIRVEAGGENGQIVKRLKLEQIFEDGVYDFSFLKAHGIRSVCSARRLPEGWELFG